MKLSYGVSYSLRIMVRLVYMVTSTAAAAQGFGEHDGNMVKTAIFWELSRFLRVRVDFKPRMPCSGILRRFSEATISFTNSADYSSLLMLVMEMGDWDMTLVSLYC